MVDQHFNVVVCVMHCSWKLVLLLVDTCSLSGRGKWTWSQSDTLQRKRRCYPDPNPGRENIKNHVTFATGKGVSIQWQ